jgi:glycosyltransferase involved in cell wall biosynthesis
MAQPDRVEVYTTLANGKEELPYQNRETKIIEGVKVTYFKRITKDHSHFSSALLIHLWQNAKTFDVIHIHAWWNLVSMASVLVCLCRGIKPIVSPRGMLGDYTMSKGKSLFHRLVGNQLLKRCNFHATTAMEAKEIAKRVFDGKVEVMDLMKTRYESQGARQKKDDNKIFIIHNSVKLPEDLPVKTRVFDGSLKLIFLSRIHHKKGIELMLDALALVNFPFKLSIVGEGEPDYVESLKSKAESLKLNEKINWVGAVYGEEKYQLLANHDAFILPSYNENFANVVIEAIAVGTPVFLSDKVGLKDYVREHDFGLIFKLDELEASLKKAYSLFTENKLHFNNVLSVIREPLTAKYIEMYDIV